MYNYRTRRRPEGRFQHIKASSGRQVALNLSKEENDEGMERLRDSEQQISTTFELQIYCSIFVLAV